MSKWAICDPRDVSPHCVTFHHPTTLRHMKLSRCASSRYAHTALCHHSEFGFFGEQMKKSSSYKPDWLRRKSWDLPLGAHPHISFHMEMFNCTDLLSGFWATPVVGNDMTCIVNRFSVMAARLSFCNQNSDKRKWVKYAQKAPKRQKTVKTSQLL